MSETNYTPEQQVKAQAAMAEAFQKPEVQSSLVLDIDNFTATVKSISNSFEVVDRKLGEIDSKNLDPQKFQPKWAGYKKRYRDLLWESRDTATNIATQAEQFGTVMLPIITGPEGGSNAERLTQIQFFTKLNEQQGKDSDRLNKAFQTLADEITDFKGTFNNFAEAKLQQLNSEIQTLESDIAGLNNEISSINKKIIGLTIGLGLVIFATVALCIVFPASTAAIASAGTGIAGSVAGALAKAYDDRSKVAKELATKTQQLKNKAATVKEIEQARTDLRNLANTEIANIVGGLQMLSDIWKNVNNDCKQIETYLTSVQNSNTDPAKDPNAPITVRAYVQNSISIYKGLAKALRLYASGVTNAQK